MYSSIETEEELEQLFNEGMNNGRDKEGKEEANQQVRKDDENQTNDISEETVEKKDNKKCYCVICEKES
jgi:hypothetical protein